MDRYPLVLLANEPSAYRSLLAAELPFLRPNLRLLEVDPAELDTAMTALHPAVVVCSRANTSLRDATSSILVLCSEEVAASLQTPDGTIANPRLSDILGAIDRAVRAHGLDLA